MVTTGFGQEEAGLGDDDVTLHGRVDLAQSAQPYRSFPNLHKPLNTQHIINMTKTHHTRRVGTVIVTQRKGLKNDSERMEFVLTIKTREAFRCSRNVDRE